MSRFLDYGSVFVGSILCNVVVNSTTWAQTTCPTGDALLAKFEQAGRVKYGESLDPQVAAAILLWNDKGAAAISSWRNEVRPKVLFCYGTKCDLTPESTQVMQRLHTFSGLQYNYKLGMDVPVLPQGLDRPPLEIFNWAKRILDCTADYRPQNIASSSKVAVVASFAEPTSIPSLRASIQAYKNYPFIDVPQATNWQPNRFKVDYLTIPSLMFLPKADLEARNKILTLIEANKGQEAINYAQEIAPALITADVEMQVVRIYQQGKAGIAKDSTLMVEWLKHAAQKDPIHYKWLGDIYNEGNVVARDIVMATHYYSKGLSRGCIVCFDGLKKATSEGTEIPIEQMVDYAAFALEMGNRNAMDTLFTLLVSPSDALLASAPRVKILRNRATALVGGNTDFRAGLAVAVFENYRSGFVPDSIVVAGEKAVNTDPIAAINIINMLVSQNNVGRYYKVALRAAIDHQGKVSSLNDNAKRFIVLEGAKWGDIQLSLAAAAILSTSGETYLDRESTTSRKLIEFSKRDLDLANSYLAAAQTLKLPLPIDGVFKLTEGQGLNLAHKGLVNSAANCLKAAKAKKDDYWFASSFKKCAPLMNKVWDVTYLVDAYHLSSFDFERLYRGEAKLAQERASIAANLKRQRDINERIENQYVDRYAPTFYYSTKAEFESEVRRIYAEKQFWANFFAEKQTVIVTPEITIADYSRARNAKIAQVNAARASGALDNTKDPACQAPMMQLTSYCKVFNSSPY